MQLLNGMKRIALPSNADDRGVLTSIESGIDIPFEIKRIFYMHHIVANRGGHAHTDTDQVVFAISGSFEMELSDGTSKITVTLDNPTHGIYIPRMIFISMYNFSPHTVCCVLASTHYDIKKSIRTWDDYIKAVR